MGAPPDTADAVVIGAGPSGLGAALALARAGARPLVVDAGPVVGGLSVTRRADGFGYDIGGHIPFVEDEQRVEYLRELLGERLLWVDRPVSCVRDGVIRPGRYLDQRPKGPVEPASPDGSASGELGVRFGTAFVDAVQRAYLEKVDGLALERIAAERARRLLLEQAAPEGFWFPAGGIGELMDAMAAAIVAAGGEVDLTAPATRIELSTGVVSAVEVLRDDAPHEIQTRDVVVAIPPAPAARMARPAPPESVVPEVSMRAVAIVYLALDVPHVTREPWIQVDDPAVPFARAFEPPNWSEEMAPPGRTILGLECYCTPDASDSVWSSTDEELSERCVRALVHPLGWIDPDVAASAAVVEVVRIANAYPSPDIAQVPAVMAPAQWLAAQPGIHLARGSAVIDAIESGERAAQAILAGRAETLA